MNTETFRFKVGRFECAAISDGSFNYPPESLFANVSRQHVEAALRGHNLPTEHVTTPYACLLVNTGQHQVLIDTGAGNIGVHAATIFPSVDHSTTVTGKLLGNLRALGIQPSEIDIVIITHAHPDHVAGTLDEAGRLVFPNAHYFIAKDEWEFWVSDVAATKAAAVMVNIARQNLVPMRDRLTLIDDAAEIVPGIQANATPGHTPGHIALSITSDGQQLLHISDVVLYPLHLEYPEWVPVFDISPEQAAISKHRIFNRAAEEHALVFGHHFPPFPNLGYVQKLETGWQWQPIGR
jgi:glyoxylase-like metal-dependent hydrolase (beta-lactamase superfamily II)